MPDTGSKHRDTVIRHVLLAATTAFIVGAFDGAWSARGTVLNPWLCAALSAGTLAIAGALLGLAQAVLLIVIEPIVQRGDWRRRWQGAMNTDAEGDRTPVVAFHAWLISAVAVGAPLVLGFASLLSRTERIKEAALRDTVLIMGAAGIVVVTLIVSSIARPTFARACEKLDRSWGLPRPRSRLLRYALFVAVPAAVLLIPLFNEFGVRLGILSAPFALGVVLGRRGSGLATCASDSKQMVRAENWTHHAHDSPAGRIPGRLGRHQPRTFRAVARSQFRSVRGTGDAIGGCEMQRLTDVDGDGVSSLFGGADCAAFDARRSPMSSEVPNNGIDDDCDGQDATASRVLPELETFHGRLPDSQKRRFNVLLLVVDSLRPDHLGAYGYTKKTSPYMDELSKDAWLFTRAYYSHPPALSMPSMLSGRRPSSLQWKGGYPETVESQWMLPQLLSNEGYETTLAINRYVVRLMKGLQRDFQQVRSVPAGVDWSSGEYIISNVISAVEDAKRVGRPFFVVAHFDDVHHPYRAHRGRSVPQFPNSDRNIAAYDRSIAHFDNMLRFLGSYLEQAGVWNDTILILTADHGEEFKEHGGTIHSVPATPSRSTYLSSCEYPDSGHSESRAGSRSRTSFQPCWKRPRCLPIALRWTAKACSFQRLHRNG